MSVNSSVEATARRRLISSRIPQVRSTPLKRVSDIKEKLERERTFTIDSPPSSPTPQPKLKERTRRQWKSFDNGVLARRDDNHEDEVLPQQKKSDAHFERLREDLAEEAANAEAHLKMASELLADNGQLADDDEVGYRQEQAVFWMVKAAERGSEEAKTRMRAMLREGKKINESSRAQIASCLSKTREELIGQRIGRSVFKKLNVGGSFVPISRLADVSETGKMPADSTDTDNGELYAFSSSPNERVSGAGCARAGTDLVRGEVPRLDDRLSDFERRAGLLSRSRDLCLRLDSTVATAQRVLIEALVRFHVIVLFALYKLFLDGSLYVLGGIAHAAVLPALAVQNVGRKLTVKGRREKWRRIFDCTLDEEEKLGSTRNAARNDAIFHVWANLIAILTVVVARRLDAEIGLFSLTTVYVVSAAISSRRPMLLIVALAMSLIEKAELMDVTVIEFMEVGYNVPPSFTMAAMADKSWVAAATVLVAIISGLNSGVHALQTIALAMFAKEFYYDEVHEALIPGTIAAVVGSILALWAHAIRQKKDRARTLLATIACIAVLHHGLLKHQESLPVSDLSWSEFRDACPRDSAATDQANCLRLVGLGVKWNGVVGAASVSEEKDVYSFLAEMIPTPLTAFWRSEDEAATCERSDRVSGILCSAGVDSRLGGRRYRVDLDVRMRLSIYREEAVGLQVGWPLWKSARFVAAGSSVEFEAVIAAVGEKVRLEARKIVITR